MTKTERTKKEKSTTTGCCCCGAKSKKLPDDDVTEPRDDKKDGGADDDASHIASINNRSHSGSVFLEVDGLKPNKSKSKKKSKGNNKKDKLSKIGKQQQETTALMTTTKPEKRKGGCKKCCVKFTAFVFSHIGLSSLVVGYSIMGGFLFQWLESDSEVQVRLDMKIVRDDYVSKLWFATNEFNVLHEGNWSTSADDIMREFQDKVYIAVKEKGWDGRDEQATEKQWSFPGSLLYSVTVITTIGYGHIAPKTAHGRLATIFYALVGIPLTLLFLANIGALFGNCFRFLYKHLCIALVWLCCPNHVQQKHPSSSKSPNKKGDKKTTLSVGVSNPRIKVDDTQNGQTIFDEKDTLQTLQWKTSSNNALDVEEGYNTADFPSGSSKDDFIQQNRDYKETLIHADCENHRKKTSTKKKLKDEVRVPICVSLLIIASYIFGGACLFSFWEKDWDYLIGSYFCFITLSTVGFGDYVFGAGSDWNDNGKLIICALYLVFGLSIIAMTFDLMQEEVRAKCKWLGTKLGLVHESDS